MPASTQTSNEPSELTWQQAWAAELQRRDRESVDQLCNRYIEFDLPDGYGDEELRQQLVHLAAREEALQVTYLEDRPDGRILFTPGLELPFEQVVVDSPEAYRETTRHLNRPLVRASGAPLWRAALVRHPDENGAVVRTLCAAFDFYLSDARSLHNFRAHVLSRDCATRGPRNGGYRDWVAWQRRTFPENPKPSDSAISSFWSRYLDGTEPDRPALFPFAGDPSSPLTGTVHSIRVELPVTAPVLRRASGSRRSSPFLLMLAALSASIAQESGADDTVLRVNVAGRPPQYQQTLGSFGDLLPVRVRHRSLADPEHALQAATTSWMDAIAYQTTPWEYTVQLCGAPGSTAPARTPQILFNFMKWGSSPVFDTGTDQFEGELGTFQFQVVTQGDRVYLACEFDPQRFAPTGVEAMLDHLCASLLKLTG
ncbi:condensation domain-containing protein [Streptomyces sp. NPDC058459]|uniref:condensation domain-containing protein n=1 Tax=Streptomyces sp. NPDC058459 TaxID=3346508 RepID=UPI003661A99B